jgi:tetratricopeptide (TPR) repeat protein
MSDRETFNSYLALLAATFEAEGDAETASALRKQLASLPLGGHMSTEESEIERLRAKAESNCARGRFKEAQPLYAKILAMRESVLGPDHIELHGGLNDLARCLYNNGDYGDALAVYSRLLRLTTTYYGSDDELTRITCYNVINCTEALNWSKATRQLLKHINAMMHGVVCDAQAHHGARLDRLYSLANRAKDCGKKERSLKLIEHWLKVRLEGSNQFCEDALNGMRQYAQFLTELGRHDLAEHTYKKIVAIRHQSNRDGRVKGALEQALRDWSQSLERLGNYLSASMTRDLAHRLTKASDLGANE